MKVVVTRRPSCHEEIVSVLSEPEDDLDGEPNLDTKNVLSQDVCP